MPSKARTIGDSLREAIKTDGRSQRELAEAAGTYQANVSRFLAGKSITIETADALAKAVGAEVTITTPAQK